MSSTFWIAISLSILTGSSWHFSSLHVYSTDWCEVCYFILSISTWNWVSNQNISIRIVLELRMVEMVVATGAIRHAMLRLNRHHQQTNTQLFTGRMPFLSPNQQYQST